MAYRDEVVADSPVAYLRLGEASGTVADDEVNAHNGAYVAAPTLGVPGIGGDGGTGVTFDRTQTEHVSIDALGTLGQNLLTSSWEIVVDNLTDTSVIMTLFGVLNTGATTALTVQLNSDTGSGTYSAGKTRLFVRSENGAQISATISTNIYDGARHHIVFVIESATTASVYVDGASQPVTYNNSGTFGAFANFGFPMVIAARNNRATIDQPASVTLAEFAAYSTRLSSSRVASHYAALIVEPVVGFNPPKTRRSVIRVIVGGRDVTRQVSALSHSNVDPGGYETCTFELPAGAEPVNEGDSVLCLDGLEPVFFGRVEEPGLLFEQGAGSNDAKQRVSCVGAGAPLKDVEHQQLYIDRDLNKWRGAPNGRRQDLLSLYGFGQVAEPAVAFDQSTPALRTGWVGGWQSGQLPICEATYDAGAGNSIGRVTADWARVPTVSSGADASWYWAIVLADDDRQAASNTTGDLQAAGPASASLDATAATRRFATLGLQYQAGPAGSDGVEWGIEWSNIAVIGNHGLALRGSGASAGYYPSDIVLFALNRDYPGPIDLRVQAASSFIIAQLAAYLTAVPLERVPDDMAKLVGYHWGVWGPSSPFSNVPVFLFQAPPAHPTATCYLSDADSADLARRLSDYHNVARVVYRDSAGVENYVTVRRTNPRMPDGMTRVLALDIGIGSAGSATAFGKFALALEEQQSRGVGSVTLPRTVITDTGPKGAHLLKSGVDRLRVLGLPNAGPLVAPDSRRFDTFRIRRVSTTWSENGTPTTTAELDAGSNLLEVLQARLQLAGAIAGVG